MVFHAIMLIRDDIHESAVVTQKPTTYCTKIVCKLHDRNVVQTTQNPNFAIHNSRYKSLDPSNFNRLQFEILHADHCETGLWRLVFTSYKFKLQMQNHMCN